MQMDREAFDKTASQNCCKITQSHTFVVSNRNNLFVGLIDALHQQDHYSYIQVCLLLYDGNT